MVEEVGYLYIVKVLCHDEKFKMSLKHGRIQYENVLKQLKYLLSKIDISGLEKVMLADVGLISTDYWVWLCEPITILQVTELSNKRSGVKSTIFSSK